MTHYQIAHAWAHDDYNRNGEINGHNVYATRHNRAIFSYGSHFCMARKTDSHRFHILMTTRGYSSSTAKHIGYVRSAVSHHGRHTFYCQDPGKSEGGIYIEEMVQLIKDIEEIDQAKQKVVDMQERIDKRASNKKPPSEQLDGWLRDRQSIVALLTDDIITRAEQLEEFRKEFNILVKNCLKNVQLIRKKFNSDAWKTLAQVDRRRAAKTRALLEAAQEASREKQMACEAEKLDRWLKGDDVQLYHQSGAARLRVTNHPIRGRRVETNQGANIRCEDAWKLWILAKRCVRNAEPLSVDSNKIRVGVYGLDYITAKGDVAIGCHRINFTEMARIADEVGAAVNANKREAE